MDLDLETFLTTLYVMTDDWYQKVILPKLPVCGGPAPKLCDSECCVWRWPPSGAAVCPGRPNGASCATP
jgi:hypothetical protein